MISGYRTVKADAELTEIVEKSKFITYIYRITSAEDAQERLQRLRKLHSASTHICYAYCADVNGTETRFSDDGEPQGTAGAPILDVLKSCELRHSLIAVVRYYGGVKLGTGGLARAYGGGAAAAVRQAGISVMTLSEVMVIEADYSQAKILSTRLTKEGCKILSSDFGGAVTLTFAAKSDEAERAVQAVSECTKGVLPNRLRTEFIDWS